MGGAKYVHGVEICSEECCPGYEEVIDNPPLLSPGKALSKGWEDEELAHSPIRMRRQSVMTHFPTIPVVYCKKIKLTRGYLMRGTVDRGYDKNPLRWYR